MRFFKKREWLILLISFSVFANLSCHRKPKVPEHQASEKQREVLVPRMVLSINRGQKAEMLQGEPAVLKAVLLHPEALSQESSAPVEIKNGSEDWRRLLKVGIRDEKGTEEFLSLQPEFPGKPEPELILEKTSQAEVRWTLSPETSKNLKPGKYEFFLKLDSFKGSVWKEAVKSGGVSVTVKSSDAELTAEAQAKKPFAEAGYFAAKGETDKALEVIGQQIQKNPDNPQNWSAKAELLVKAGKKKEAYAAYGTAIEKVQASNPSEPPRYLMHEREALFQEMLKEQPDTIDPNFKDPQEDIPETMPNPAVSSQPAARTPQAVNASAVVQLVPVPSNPVPAIQGDINITLHWEDPVDVDLKVVTQDGLKQKLDQEASQGPGTESFVLKMEDQQSGQKYYAAAALIGAYGSQAKVTMTVVLPGKAPLIKEVPLVYDGTHQFWIGFEIDTQTATARELNLFEPLESYLKKKS